MWSSPEGRLLLQQRLGLPRRSTSVQLHELPVRLWRRLHAGGGDALGRVGQAPADAALPASHVARAQQRGEEGGGWLAGCGSSLPASAAGTLPASGGRVCLMGQGA